TVAAPMRGSPGTEGGSLSESRVAHAAIHPGGGRQLPESGVQPMMRRNVGAVIASAANVRSAPPSERQPEIQPPANRHRVRRARIGPNVDAVAAPVDRGGLVSRR